MQCLWQEPLDIVIIADETDTLSYAIRHIYTCFYTTNILIHPYIYPYILQEEKVHVNWDIYI